MTAKQKLDAAIDQVRPDLREEFLRDLVHRMYGSLVIATEDCAGCYEPEYAECIAQALEAVDVPRQGVQR